MTAVDEKTKASAMFALRLPLFCQRRRGNGCRGGLDNTALMRLQKANASEINGAMGTRGAVEVCEAVANS